MKHFFTSLLFIGCLSFSAQQNYNDFEGNKTASLAEWNGTMDSAHVNPLSNSVNSSSFCAKYIRDTALYDNFKIFPYAKLTDVTPYASSTASNKITMKIFTSAAPGTPIDIQLGTRTNTTFPAGVHSMYTGNTAVQNAWHTVTFNFVMMPAGSTTAPTDIDKIVVFFRPNSHVHDTVYFDDPTGPMETVIGLKEITKTQAALKALPNPADRSATLQFTLSKTETIKISIKDIYGKEVIPAISNEYKAGPNSVNIDTSVLPAGIYFYTAHLGDSVQTEKLIITH